MSSTLSKEELEKQLSEIAARFEQTRKLLLDEDEKYDADGMVYEEKIIAHANRFLERQERRAEEIKGAARRVVSFTKAFTATRSNFFTKVALSHLAMKQEVLASASDFLAQTISNFTGGSRPPEAFEFQLRAIHATATVCDMQDLAANLIKLRMLTLQTFVDEHIDIDVETIMKGVRQVVEDDSKEELFKALAEAVGIVIEEIEPIMRARSIWLRIKEEVLKLHKPYRPRGAEDSLFELARLLEEQNSVLELSTEMMQRSLRTLTRAA